MKPNDPSFSGFDHRARNGETLNVAFLGGSLTWGARATDPQLTSYRALIGRRLREFYPKTHFYFWDAAIGGTNSQLAVFRLQRDVLLRQPDLVFIDFTVNDHPFTVDTGRLAAYESLVRRCILEAQAPVVQMLLGLKQDLATTPQQDRPLDREHKKISRTYNTGLGDATTWMRDNFLAGSADPEQLWPYFPDVTHPGDKGYALYAEAAWNALREAIEQEKVCRAPEHMLHLPTYSNWTRQRLTQIPLPKGWRAGLPHSAGVAFDFYMSRWLDDVLIASSGAEPIRLVVEGAMALLFGESTSLSGKLEVKIDGQPVSKPDGIFSAQCAYGNGHWVPIIAADMDPAQRHLIELTPLLEVGQELRIESVCVAGPHRASVSPLDPSDEGEFFPCTQFNRKRSPR